MCIHTCVCICMNVYTHTRLYVHVIQFNLPEMERWKLLHKSLRRLADQRRQCWEKEEDFWLVAQQSPTVLGLMLINTIFSHTQEVKISATDVG